MNAETQRRDQSSSACAGKPQARLCHRPAAMASPNTVTPIAMARGHGYWPCSAR